MRSFFLVLGFLLVTGLWVKAGQTPFVLQPGVLVGPGEETVYVMSPSGQIEAIAVVDGKLTWKTDDASQPLALEGSDLVALAESDSGLEVVFLSLDGTGQRRAPLPLPTDAWSFIDKGLGTSLYVASGRVGDETLFWYRSENQDISGMARPQNPVELKGALVWNNQEGFLQSRAGLPESPEAPRLTLLPASERIENVNGVQWLSADGGHVMVSERIADDRVWEKYRWTLYERSSKQRLGEVLDHFSTAAFFVTGKTLVYLAHPYERLSGKKMEAKELRLRAMDLSTGFEIWQREVRDTSYRGPMPP